MTRWQEIGHLAGFAEMWREQFGEIPPPRALKHGALTALVGREPVATGDERWHISISREDRVPSWDEMVSAVHELRPGDVFAIGIPPRSWWINVHEHTLHLWELHDDALVDQWRSERMNHVPS